LARSTELRALEDNSIGREHYLKKKIDLELRSGVPAADKILSQVRAENPLRAHIAAQYLIEMQEALRTCGRLLKPGGIFVLVSGANELCGHVFDTTKYLRSLCVGENLAVRFELTDSIHSRGLMTRRNKTAGLIPFESVTVLEKL
jgi:SAM-dependent methyltransferase